MEFISGIFFTGFYVFSILSICWWVYQAYAHDGAGAYLYLSEQKSGFFLNRSILSAVKKHFELVSILVCFLIFLYALCQGLAEYFSWIPERYHLILGDGTILHLSTIMSCLVGICSALIFAKWVLIGITSYWEKRALAEQSVLYFDIIHKADNIDELSKLKTRTLKEITALKDNHTVTPEIVCQRLELGIKIIDLRIKDIQSIGLDELFD
tara:strand:- start:92 stop:721 length:630 start_codon:yes stop_codon:yes gene_type:complete